LRRESLRFEFERRGAFVTMSQRDAGKTAFNPYGDLAATPLATCGEAELDTPLQAAKTVLPEFPLALKGKVREGTATVSFIVDGAGRVRVPVITDATLPEFGAAALAALRAWQFQPARRGGRLVQVAVDRTLLFRLRAGAE
jgi:TonB family protein